MYVGGKLIDYEGTLLYNVCVIFNNMAYIPVQTGGQPNFIVYMKLDNNELYHLLIEKGIHCLHHANTVSTSITFISQEGLMSRGGIESKGLFQSEQSSDNDDKKYNVWNDIFLDCKDLHGYFPRQNFYGPVLFKFPVELILQEDYNIWVTKNNPIYWNDEMTDSEKYFSSVSELREKWDLYQCQKKMITIRNVFEAILFEYLTEIIVDNPRVRVSGIELFQESIKGLKSAIAEKTYLIGKIKERSCSSACYCRSNYLDRVSSQDLKRLFLPIII